MPYQQSSFSEEWDAMTFVLLQKSHQHETRWVGKAECFQKDDSGCKQVQTCADVRHKCTDARISLNVSVHLFLLASLCLSPLLSSSLLTEHHPFLFSLVVLEYANNKSVSS